MKCRLLAAINLWLFFVTGSVQAQHMLYTDDFTADFVTIFNEAKAYAFNHSNPCLSPLHLFLVITQKNTFSQCASALDINPQEIRVAVQQEVEKLPRAWGQGLVADPQLESFLNECRQEAVTLQEQYIDTHIALAACAGSNIFPAGLRTTLSTKKLTKERVIEWIKKSKAEKQQAAEAEETTHPTLTKFSKDLTQLARDGKLDPLVGREQELDRAIVILARRTKNNPVLVGEPGVGKTALVEGLAQRIIAGKVPDCLKDKKVLSLDLGSLVAGSQMRGEFEFRMKTLIDEMEQGGDNIILFIDEIHTLVGAGSVGAGGMDTSNLLKPSLARGQLHCIGAATLVEYKKYIERDAALERRFQKVLIEEPDLENAEEILAGLKKLYEKYHGVTITPEAINKAVSLGAKMIQDRFLPDKAIDLLDEACAMAKIASPPKKEIVAQDIAKVISLWLKIPVEKLTTDETEKLLALEKELHKRVIGQEKAIEKVANVIRLQRAGMHNPDKPLGVFLFLGPTGVGKTETARALADYLFNDERKMIRVDMSEYRERHSIARLIGSPPGYVGHDDGGQLTEAVRKHPYSIVLFDELEKAHPDVFNIFLQLFDDGQLTDGQGRTVSFKNCIIIMTSNIGSHTILQADEITEQVRQDIDKQLYLYLRPELINRIDDVVYFNHFSNDELKQIVLLQLTSLKKRLSEQDITLTVNDDVIDHIVTTSDTKHFGARPLKRALQRLITTPLTNAMLKYPYKQTFVAKMRNDTIHITYPPDPQDFQQKK